MAKKTVRQSNKQSYNDVDSISNSTSRPVQSRLRPTTRDLPVNKTGVKHHLNVVKIKRKLVTATMQSTSVSTITTTDAPITLASTTSAITTTSIKPLVKADVAKKFLLLPDVLPVPLMFRRHPASMATMEHTTPIQLSTSLTSPTIDKQKETIVFTTTIPSQFTNKSSEVMQPSVNR